MKNMIFEHLMLNIEIDKAPTLNDFVKCPGCLLE